MNFFKKLFETQPDPIWPDDSKPGIFHFETRLENLDLSVITKVQSGIAPVNIWVSPDPRNTMVFKTSTFKFLERENFEFDIVLVYPEIDWSSKQSRENTKPIGKVPKKYYQNLMIYYLDETRDFEASYNVKTKRLQLKLFCNP